MTLNTEARVWLGLARTDRDAGRLASCRTHVLLALRAMRAWVRTRNPR